MIINACLEVSYIVIPRQSHVLSPAGIPVWQEHVAEQRLSIFRHIIWEQCGSPKKAPE